MKKSKNSILKIIYDKIREEDDCGDKELSNGINTL